MSGHAFTPPFAIQPERPRGYSTNPGVRRLIYRAASATRAQVLAISELWFQEYSSCTPSRQSKHWTICLDFDTPGRISSKTLLCAVAMLGHGPSVCSAMQCNASRPSGIAPSWRFFSDRQAVQGAGLIGGHLQQLQEWPITNFHAESIVASTSNGIFQYAQEYGRTGAVPVSGSVPRYIPLLLH